MEVLSLKGSNLRQFRWHECAMVFQSALNALNPVLRISEHFVDTAKAHGYLSGLSQSPGRFESVPCICCHWCGWIQARLALLST